MVRHTVKSIRVEDDMHIMREQMRSSTVSSVPTFDQNIIINSTVGLYQNYENMLLFQMEEFGDRSWREIIRFIDRDSIDRFDRN